MALEVEERKKSVIYVRQQATAVIAFNSVPPGMNYTHLISRDVLLLGMTQRHWSCFDSG